MSNENRKHQTAYFTTDACRPGKVLVTFLTPPHNLGWHKKKEKKRKSDNNVIE